MNNSRTQGSAFVIIIIILTIAIIGALGFVLWQNFIRSDVDMNNSSITQKTSEQKAQASCANTSDDVVVDGVFCSEKIGIEFKIPEIFKNKLQKAENYDITEGPMGSFRGTPAGKSIVNYEAIVTSGEETLSLTVAMEPLRSGYSSIGHALQRTYFNAETKDLHFVEGTLSEYDSSTDTYKVAQEGYAGKSVPSFAVDGIKVFYGNLGDAGVIENSYLIVMNSHLVVVKIKHVINPMNEPAINIDKPFADLDSYLKQLKVLK